MNLNNFFTVHNGDIDLNDNVPFKKSLSDIFNPGRTNEKGEKDGILPNHMRFMMEMSQNYSSNRYKKLLDNDDDLSTFNSLIEKINSHIGSKNDNFIEILALYHDIGKTIEVDNHPQIGTYILRDFRPLQKEALLKELDSERDKLFALLLSVVQHHDKFGVVQTGEASFSIFSDIPYHASKLETKDGVLKNISYVCLVNLLDIAAYVTQNQTPLKIKSEPLNIIKGDYELLIKFIEEADGERDALRKKLSELDRKSFSSIERIKRLLKNSTQVFPKISDKINVDYITTTVPRALQCPFSEFSENFARIVKLDYSLRFFQSLVYGICEKEIEKPTDWKTMDESEKKATTCSLVSNMHPAKIDNIRDIITIKILKVLERFVLRYKWVLQSTYNNKHQRIGYEMKGIISNQRIKTSIINSLIKEETEPAALNWITDKTPIWSFD